MKLPASQPNSEEPLMISHDASDVSTLVVKMYSAVIWTMAPANMMDMRTNVAEMKIRPYFGLSQSQAKTSEPGYRGLPHW